MTELHETSIPVSIDNEESKDGETKKKTKRGSKTWKIITTEHVSLAITTHLRSLSIINDNEEVVSWFKVPEGIEVKIGEMNV